MVPTTVQVSVIVWYAKTCFGKEGRCRGGNAIPSPVAPLKTKMCDCPIAIAAAAASERLSVF